MTSMKGHCRHHDETARNPQHRPVLTVAAGWRVPTQGNADGSGATFPRYWFNRYRELTNPPAALALLRLLRDGVASLVNMDEKTG